MEAQGYTNGEAFLDEEISTDEVLLKAYALTSNIFSKALVQGQPESRTFVEFANELVDKIIEIPGNEDSKVLAGVMAGIALAEWGNGA